MASYHDWHKRMRDLDTHDAYRRVVWYGSTIRVVRFGPNAWRVYHHTPGQLTRVLSEQTFAPRVGDGAALVASYLHEWQRESVKMPV